MCFPRGTGTRSTRSRRVDQRRPSEVVEADLVSAAGIGYDRTLWRLWTENPTLEDRRNFMLGSYNAGRGTLLRAQNTARETLQYVTKIEALLARLKGEGVRP